MPVSYSKVMGLNPLAQRQEARPMGPFVLFRPIPILKEAIMKWEQEVQIADLP